MPSRRFAQFALTLLLLSAGSAQALTPPKPFRAEYEVRRNGMPLGTARMEWKALGDDRWQLHTETEATGLAALAGAKLSETSQLRWQPNLVETIAYQAQQDLAWRDSSRSLKPLPAQGKIVLSDRKGSVEIPYRPGFVDRHAFLVLLMAQAAESQQGELKVSVAEREGIATHTYRREGETQVSTADGNLRGLSFERVRQDPNGRSSELCLARDRGWVPLKLVQREPDGDVMEMRLLRIE